MSFYFLFLESLGTPELVLILLVALIVFGPRKLPQIGKTIGKYTSEFKRASQDFKQTWEREIEMEQFSDLTATQLKTGSTAENTIGRSSARVVEFEENNVTVEGIDALPQDNSTVAAPAVRELSEAEFNSSAAVFNQEAQETVEAAAPQRKRDWL